MIPQIGNAIFSILNAKKEQEQQRAMFEIIKQALTPTTETSSRGANPDEIMAYIQQANNQPAGPAPMPEIPMGQPAPFMSNQPSFMGGIPNPNEPQFQPKFQTVGETSGAMNANEIDPIKLGQQLGLTQELTKQKSALQMYQAMMEHPLFNSLQPGQAEKVIQLITGIRKMMPEVQPIQQDPYTLSPGQKRFDPQGNVISEIPASDRDTSIQEANLKLNQDKLALEKSKPIVIAGVAYNPIPDPVTGKMIPLTEKQVNTRQEFTDKYLAGNITPDDVAKGVALGWLKQDKTTATVKRNYATKQEADAQKKAVEAQGRLGVVYQTPDKLWHLDTYSTRTEEETASERLQAKKNAYVHEILSTYKYGKVMSAAGFVMPSRPIKDYNEALAIAIEEGADITDPQVRADLDLYKGGSATNIATTTKPNAPVGTPILKTQIKTKEDLATAWLQKNNQPVTPANIAAVIKKYKL